MSVQQCINTLVSSLPGSHAVLSPGSRNAPVIYALDHSGLTCHSIIDERSAAFVALGIAKSTREPVILSCTSGTAALNYSPAVAEAYYARVPLIILTADRPAESIDSWDGQAIRQKGMYANHIRAEFATPDSYDDASNFAAIAQRIKNCLATEISGPIHVNIPIREPFYSFTLEGLATNTEYKPKPQKLQNVTVASIAKHLNEDFSFKKVLVFNGMEDDENITVASDDGTIMLSDITSNQTSDVHYWDAMLFSAQSKLKGLDFLEVLRPDILITTGTTTVSKGLKLFLQHHKPSLHIHLTKHFEVGDMFGTVPKILNPANVKSIPETDQDINGERDGAYVSAWLHMTQEFKTRFGQLDWSSYNEFTATNYVLQNLPKSAVLHISNSMPVRYVSFLLNSDMSNNVVYCNRGTSGIDGSTSTAVGNALVTEQDVYLITGDVAFFYDINGLFITKLPSNLKIIILNNHAGGIFEMIAGPEQMGEALAFQTTPHRYTAEHLATHFGVGYFAADTIGSFAKGYDVLRASPASFILEVRTSSAANKQFFELFKKA
jgi:2-succinyl-5-enolpyruvyl-6-hydroxy-3-cyclohexene-1-carboxylate synthase